MWGESLYPILPLGVFFFQCASYVTRWDLSLNVWLVAIRILKDFLNIVNGLVKTFLSI